MQAVFNAKRESNNHLFFMDWENDSGVFSFHSQIELYFINEGEMEVFVDDCHTVLKKGEMSIALSYVPHGYKTPVSSASSALIIPTHLCEKFVEETRRKKAVEPFIRDKETVEKIKDLFARLRREGINEIEQLGYIYVILGIILDALSFEEKTEPPESSLASRLLFYINENYQKGISPADVAEHFNYSGSYISRYFKKKFGITLNKYLTVVKLKNAILLMQEQKQSVTLCALESGFGSTRSFYRAFYNEFGCSPSEYMSNK